MLLFILVWVMMYPSGAAQLIIKVDPINGTNDTVCWTGNVSCKGLNYALEGVNRNNTKIQLFNGSINLQLFNTTVSGLSYITRNWNDKNYYTVQ